MKIKNIIAFLAIISLSFVCFGCDYEFPSSNPNIEDHEHYLVKEKEVLPTCTNKGVKAHFVCHICGKTFLDSNAKNERPLSDLEIEKIPHEFVDKNCINCGLSNYHHNHETVVLLEELQPTCQYDGYKEHYACSECKIVFSDMNKTYILDSETVKIKRLPHEFVSNECTKCGYKVGELITKEQWDEYWNFTNYKYSIVRDLYTSEHLYLDGVLQVTHIYKGSFFFQEPYVTSYDYYYYDSNNERYWEMFTNVNDNPNKHPITLEEFEQKCDIKKRLYAPFEKLKMNGYANLYAEIDGNIVEYVIVDSIIQEIIVTEKENESITYKFDVINENDSIVIPEAHYYEEQIIIEASCQNEGLVLYQCIDCDKSSEAVIPKYDHQYDYLNKGICSYCGEVDPNYVDPYLNAKYDFRYELNEDGYRITGITGEATNVRIPDNINGIEVTEIGFHAFDNIIHMETIFIPNTITTISVLAFNECINLKTVIYDGTLEMWNNINKAESWFSWSDITKIQCTDGEIIHEHTLEYNPGIIATCTTYGEKESYVCSDCHMSFYDKDGTKPLLSNDKTIFPVEHQIEGDYCVVCNGLVKDNVLYRLKEDGTYIADDIVILSEDLIDIVILDNIDDIAVTEIASDAFVKYGFHTKKSYIKSIVIGNNITHIPDYLFTNFNKLEKLVISASVTTIGVCCF